MEEQILFGFEGIRGFPLDYDRWCELLTPLLYAPDLETSTRAIESHLDWLVSDPELRDDPAAVTWAETRDLGAVLDRHLFVEHDQAVLPALNLKSAKTIVCGREREKKALRRMGFIEDRIQIRNVKR